ncbi:MAG: NAD-dependent epimerase/dehydratase family protein [Chloroflexi bacterium]|nr:NAD-dependent epimerase/dehydratase family protein [Chloroflexota bacterium]
MTNLHVVFGAGPLGRYTATALLEMGHIVRLVNRSGQMADAPAGAQIVASDAYDLAQNREVTQGATAVYQCAQPHYHEWAEKFPPLQRAILEGAAANGAKLVVGDNLYMYGRPSGPLREDSPVNPHTQKGKVRAAMAQEVLDAHVSGKIRAAIGRASDFFGPYDTALTDYAIRPAVAGKPVNLLGKTDQPHTFTYVKDFGRLLATLGTREEALGQVWFAPSNPPITQAELVRLIAAELGQPVKSRTAGPLMMRLLGLFNKSMAETMEMMYEWTAPFVVDTSKAEKAFGLQATPLNQALRETLAWR